MNTQNGTVLTVDDEPVVRKLLGASLSSNGYICFEAGSVKEALELLKNHPVDVALLDIKMPGKSGVELLSEITLSYPNTAVIMISAVSDSETAIECMRQGAYDYIVKPFNPIEVVLRIKHAYEKMKLRLDNMDYQEHLEDKVKKRTESYHASEENFKYSVDNSPLGIRIVIDGKKTIYANQTILDIFGYSSIEELDSIPIEKRLTPESYIAHLKRLEKRQRGEPETSHYILDFVRKDGEIRHLIVNRGEVLWNGEKRFQMLYQDITSRVQTEKALKDSNAKLKKNLDAVIQMIALTVETRDPYTAGHQRRVARLAKAIGGELHLDPEKIHGIFVAGYIHDIGKISVPAEILSKPGRITEVELSLIKEHSKIGYDILKGIDFPWPIAQTVLQHHERMDGSGYPDHLSGENIILEAKIIGVSDVVEAMASHRPYRSALGINKALEEISQKKEILYDSDVVDACLRVFASGFNLDSV